MAHALLLPRLSRLLRTTLAGDGSASLRRPRRTSAKGPNRRSLLAGGAAALLAPPFPAFAQGTGARVAVIGGGLAGLTAAWHLREAGHIPTVYEGTGRVGGRVRSGVGLVAPGIVTEYGGQFVNSDHADMIGLAERYSIRLINVLETAAATGAPGSAFDLAGRRVPEAELADMLRPLAVQLAEDAARLEADWDAAAPPLDALSVADYLHRHGNLTTIETRGLIAAVVRSENGAEPDACSALALVYTLPTVADGAVEPLSHSDEMYMVEGGSQTIVTALARDLEGSIRLGRRVQRIEARGDGQRIAFRNGEVVEVDATVLAVPVTALKTLVLDLPLPVLMDAFIAEVTLGRNEKAFAGFSSRPWQRPDGFATDIWSDRDVTLVWDDGLRQPDSTASALTLYTAAGVTVDLHDRGPETFVEAALAGFGRDFPWLAPAYNGNAGNTAWTLTPYLSGAYAHFAPGQMTKFADCMWIESEAADEANQVVEGTLAFAGEAFSDAYWGYMNGGSETGRLAAAAVTEALAAR